MKISIRGDKITVTKAIKEYITEKLGRLDKYFEKPKEIECKVLIKVKNQDQSIEVTVPTSKFTLRAEERHQDLYAATDLVIDKLEGQIRKNKAKLEKKYRDVPKFEMNFDYEEIPEVEEEGKIVKRKDIDMKPMDEEEAILQLELLGHEFYLFKNIDTDKEAVIYKRKNGGYGIIEAE